jgi:hypothetical protein
MKRPGAKIQKKLRVRLKHEHRDFMQREIER